MTMKLWRGRRKKYIIHNDLSASDCSIGRGSHISSVWRRFGGSLYETEGMCLVAMFHKEAPEQKWCLFGGVQNDRHGGVGISRVWQQHHDNRGR
jgi:hypothetical protein